QTTKFIPTIPFHQVVAVKGFENVWRGGKFSVWEWQEHEAHQPAWQGQAEFIQQLEPELACRRNQDETLDSLRVGVGIFGDDGPAERMTDQNEFPIDLQHVQRGLEIGLDLSHLIAARRFIGKAVPAQVEGNDAVLHRKFLKLIMPLRGLSAEAVQENKSPLGMIRRDVNRRKPHQRTG